jgi:hypothetical protein
MMKFSLEMNERVALFLVGLVAAVSAIGIATGAPQDLGHGTGEIAPGTFYGGGNYIFPSTSNVGMGVSNPSARLDVSGNIIASGSIKATNVGDVFTRWGNGTCPNEEAKTTSIYNGVGFGGLHTHSSSSNSICVNSGDPGTTTVSDGDLLYPTTTGDASNGRMPPGITAAKIVKCSVCYAEGPVLEMWGTQTCPAGWAAAYKGYSMGSYFSGHAVRERLCIESQYFDSSLASTGSGNLIYATSVWNNPGTYTSYMNKHLKCAVCVKS